MDYENKNYKDHYILISKFGHLATLQGFKNEENTVVINIVSILKKSDYIYVRLEDLEEKYDGVCDILNDGETTWFERFFPEM